MHSSDLIRANFGSTSFDGNTLVGYAAVFNTWTDINSWEGRFQERIQPGAFRDTIHRSGTNIKVLFNHGMDPSIGDKPLGKPSVVREDDHGLYVEVPLDDTSYNRDIKALLKSGALDGMSFRMNVVNDEWDEDGDTPQRTIKAVRLHEFGPVTFPAYQATTAGVRGREAYRSWLQTHPREPADSGSSTDAPPTDWQAKRNATLEVVRHTIQQLEERSGTQRVLRAGDPPHAGHQRRTRAPR